MTEPIIQANTPTPDTLTDDILALLSGTGYPGGLGEPPATLPDKPYWRLYPAPGMHRPRVYGNRASSQTEWIVRVAVAAKTVDGMHACAQAVSNRLLGQRPGRDRSTSPITELFEPSPPIFDGPPGDRRASTTLTYRYYTRSTPNV